MRAPLHCGHKSKPMKRWTVKALDYLWCPTCKVPRAVVRKGRNL